MLYETLKQLFVYFLWPYTLFIFILFSFCILLAYILHKTKSKTASISFKSKAKIWLKVALSVYLIPTIVLLLYIFIYPNQIDSLMNYYWIINDFMGDIKQWLVNSYLFPLLLCFVLSLSFLLVLFNEYNIVFSRKALIVYLVISIPLIWGVFYLVSKLGFISIILLFGIIGALFPFLKF